jgi:signal transduction histidine kinase
MSQTISSEIKNDILIVDDDLLGLRLLSNLLVEYGHEVRSARDGSTALMMVAADPPDMILLDIQMPGIDGYQVCEQLKCNPASRDIPVLFISARDEVSDKTKGFAVGGVDYINKPYKGEEIQARIKTHLTVSRMHAELIERLNALSALHLISKAIATTRELPQALEVVCKTINDLFKVRLTFIAIQSNDSTLIKGLIGFERKSGTISLASAESTLLDPSIFRLVQSERKSSVIASLQSMPVPGPVRKYVRENNLLSGLIVPLTSRGVIMGFLILAKDESGATFDKNEIELAETIATDIAARIENDRLTEQSRLAAVDAERQRLARELHDSVTQSIYSLTLLSSGWESMARQGTLDDPADAFRRLGAVGQQALREMRLLINQLRPSILEEEGLVNAIQLRLDNVERRSNIDAQLIIQGELIDLPKEIEDELFNIAQEALNNSLRHAMAASVTVLIQADHSKITLDVEDDGIGFDPASKHTGMGLQNMLERANSIGGELTIRSEAEHGTRVTVSAEVHKDKQDK